MNAAARVRRRASVGGDRRMLRSCRRLPELIEAAADDVPDVRLHGQLTVNKNAEVTNCVCRL